MIFAAEFSLNSAHQLENSTVGILEADHADPSAPGAGDLFEWRDELDSFGLQILVGPVDVVHREGDSANSDVVEAWIGLTLSGRVDELHEVKHRGVGIIAEAHEYAAQFFRLDAQRVAHTRIVERKIVDLVEAEILVEANRAIHVAHANVHMK